VKAGGMGQQHSTTPLQAAKGPPGNPAQGSPIKSFHLCQVFHSHDTGISAQLPVHRSMQLDWPTPHTVTEEEKYAWAF